MWCGEVEAKGRRADGVEASAKTDDANGRKVGLHGVNATGSSDDEVEKAEEERETDGAAVSLQKRSKEAMARLRAAGVPDDLDWVHPQSMLSYDSMGDPSTTAQVHPYQFTTSIAQLAQEKGVKFRLGEVTAINKSPSSAAVESVSFTDKQSGGAETVAATDVVVAAGPWTSRVLPTTPIGALRAHSVTIKPSRPVSPYALFTEIKMPMSMSSKGKKRSTNTVKATPEIYARPNDEVYACGEGDTLAPLPASTDLVQVDQTRCDSIIEQVGSISDELRSGEVKVRQACYLPNVETGGGPMIGRTNVEGLYVASGHTCWGIQNGPATGKLMSEFVWDGEAKSADVRSLDPRRVFKA